MSVLVTGAAGFIGYSITKALLGKGRQVIGVDNLNDYYDVSLKQTRLSDLLQRTGFRASHLSTIKTNEFPLHLEKFQ